MTNLEKGKWHLTQVRFLHGLQGKGGHYPVIRASAPRLLVQRIEVHLSAPGSQEDPPTYPHSRSWSDSLSSPGLEETHHEL